MVVREDSHFLIIYLRYILFRFRLNFKNSWVSGDYRIYIFRIFAAV